MQQISIEKLKYWFFFKNIEDVKDHVCPGEEEGTTWKVSVIHPATVAYQFPKDLHDGHR